VVTTMVPAVPVAAPVAALVLHRIENGEFTH
jgi:hypothetical protein